MNDAPLARFAPAAIAVALAVAAGLWLAPLGLALSPDGAHYMNVALRLAYDGFELVEPKYPIGYPVLVRLAMPFEPFPLDASLWVAILCFGITLAATGSLARRISSHAAWPCAAVLACAFFVPVWNAHLYALSEAPFTSLLVLHAVCVARHIEGSGGDAKAGLRWFALAALCAGASSVVRVMGYALIAAFSVYALAWFLRGTRDARSRARLFAAHSLSYLPPVAIGIANLLGGRGVHGDRPTGEAAASFSSNVERAFSTLSSDLGPALGATLVASLVAFFVYLHRSGTARGSEPVSSTSAPAVYLYLVALVAVYVPVLIAGASLVKISPIGTRFLMPVYPIFLLLVLGVARFAPTPLRKIGGVLAALSFAHAIGLGVPELRRMNADFARTAESATATHLAVGYDASPSAQAVRDFVGEVANSPSAASLSSLFPMPRGGQHARLARALLLRSSSVVASGEPARFRIDAANEFDLGIGEATASLRYIDLPITGQDSLDARTLLGTVFGVMRDAELREHWLLTAAPGDPLQPMGDLVAGPLVIRERRALGAFNAYLFALRTPQLGVSAR